MTDSGAGNAQAGNGSQHSIGAGTDAETLLRADHRKVEQLFQRYGNEQEDEAKGALATQVCRELIVHTLLEEELFYPALRRKGVDDELLDEAQVEHDGAKVLIADLMEGEPSEEYYDAKIKTLSEYVKHHVGEEEKPGTGIFAKAQEAGVDMEGLGKRIQARKTELMSRIEEIGSRPPKTRALHVNLQYQENRGMSRYSDDRPRDEEGRFMGEGRSRTSRSRYEDEDDYRGSSRGRGQGGWFGDAQGHSEASREGWEHRGPSRSSRGRYEDDDDYRGSHGRGGSGHGGWFGDSEDHSEASREGWEHRGPSRSSRGRYEEEDEYRGSSRGRGGSGHGGWYGDAQGHSEASREGWEQRGHSRSSRSRYEDEDDDRRSSRGRGHGGWFGDAQGHSEASREGWERR